MREILSSIFGFALTLMLYSPASPAQAIACSPDEAAALLSPTDPAFSDAMELGRTLSDHGFTIRCVLTSKLGSLFKNLEGAALYRTDRGDFDALFLPTPQTFAELQIGERQGKKAFVYTFTGKSRSWAFNRLESVQREYFLKHESQLLILDDDQLRTKLIEALNLPRDN
ncbi:MAG TPA: hypothetical protein VLT90_02550 [Terriglobales bacterium]|nr:hypothetical protein [Terriglobales bacterium]